MDGDAYRDMSHSEMQQFIWQKVQAFADYANIEQRLPNNKKADVFYQVGQIRVIVEVKTIVRQSLIEIAWEKYNTQCDYLVIASPAQLIGQDCGPQLSNWRNAQLDRIGLWWVSWLGISEIRPACRLDVKTPGHVIHMSRASSPFTVNATPGCTAPRP